MKIITEEYKLDKIPELLVVSPPVSETIKFNDTTFTQDNLKGKKIVFLPVNNSNSPDISGSGGHWSLLVYDVPEKSFYYYDSLGTANLSSANKLAKNFINIVGETLAKELEVIKSPKQNDGSSCGVYTMAFIKLLVDRYEKNPSSMN
jgi:sentrin-specific protease 8